MYKMKQYKRALIATMALLLTTIGAWADGNVVVIQQLDGVTSNESLGTVSSSISGTTCTLTVTPNSSYYTQGVTAVKTIGSGQVRTRTPEVDASQITVTAADPSADISGATNWTLTMPQSPYDVEVTVNFSSRTSIAGAVLTLNPTSFSYDGKAKEPAITKISDQKGTELKLTAGTDYTIAYSNNTNVPGANDPQPTVTITGINRYTGAASATFTIAKADITPTVSITGWTYGATANTPTVSGNTDNGTVTYTYAAQGTETFSKTVPTAAGNYTVKATIAETANYNGAEATANFTISKAAGSISFAETTVSKTFGDNAFTNEATNTGDGAVSYSSSATNVATVDAGTGLVTIVGAGEATITATVTDGSNYTYATKTASYTLNVATDAMEVSATGYDGTYDGQAHTITVNAPQGATVMYGTTEGTYKLQAAPTYTDAGNYTVYYQVTMKNFTTVTGSKTVTIAKANATITKAPEAIAELKDTGKEQVLITAGEAEGGEMVYSTDGTNYSAELPTATAEGTYTIYYKVAGDANHNDTEVQTLSVTIATGIKTYALWINDTQVTEKNVNDVLGDDFTNGGGSFQYFPEKNVLFVIANNTGANILSRIPEGLTVYLFATTENSLGSISGIGTLTITTDGNFPGLLNLNAGGNVISGFTSLVLGENLGILAPEGISYEDGVLPTLNATIGVSLIPIAEMKDEDMADIGENPDGTEIDLSNYIFDDRVLFTLKRTQSDDGDGATEDGGIIISTPLTLSQLNELAGKGVATIPPGTDEFAECFTGITILVPAGEGVIEIDGLTMDGYIMGVRSLFSNELIELRQSKDEKREKMLFEYKFDQPTFVGIYNNGRSSSAASARAIQRAKKKVGSVTIYGISIKPRKISTANSASAASGGSYTPPNDGNPDNPGNLPPVGQNPLEPDIISGIRNVQTTVITDGKWYNLNGQQIDEPKQKGLYIHNGKKILIK